MLVDICLLCKSNFDLVADDSMAFCLQKARDGFLIGAGGGPPCETLSAAGCVNDDGSAPVRLRSGSHIWEGPGISFKQNNARADIPARTRFLPSFMSMLAKGTCLAV